MISKTQDTALVKESSKLTTNVSSTSSNIAQVVTLAGVATAVTAAVTAAPATMAIAAVVAGVGAATELIGRRFGNVVKITDTKTGKVVARVPINLRGLNYTPSNEEYFNEAWQCAVEDGQVDPTRRDDYRFEF